MSAASFCLCTDYLPRAETRILGREWGIETAQAQVVLLNVLVLLCDFSGLTMYAERDYFNPILPIKRDREKITASFSTKSPREKDC